MKEKTCCFTGHRKIPSSEYQKIFFETEQTVENLIRQGYLCFAAGGAIGFDYEKKNVMRSKSSDKRRIHTEYRKHFA